MYSLSDTLTRDFEEWSSDAKAQGQVEFIHKVKNMAMSVQGSQFW